jgi:hypothetical protein
VARSSRVTRPALALLVGWSLQASSSRASVALLPIDAVELGADGPRVGAALEQAVRRTIGEDLRVVDPSIVDGDSGACLADDRCVARIAGDDADEVLFVRVDRVGATASVWGRVVLTLRPVRGGRILTFAAPVTTATADDDVRALLLRAYEPAGYQGSLDIRGRAAADVILVDGLRIEGTPLRLRPGSHDIVVWRADGRRTSTTVIVPFAGRVAVDVSRPPEPATGSSDGEASATTATRRQPGVRRAASEPPMDARSGWPLAAHAGIALAAVVGLGVVGVVGEEAAIPPARDVARAGGISLVMVAVAATTAAVIEAVRWSGGTGGMPRSPGAPRDGERR